MISDEGQLRAAYTMRDAAQEMSMAADRLETVLHQIKVLTEDGYGNNVTVLIELLRSVELKDKE